MSSQEYVYQFYEESNNLSLILIVAKYNIIYLTIIVIGFIGIS